MNRSKTAALALAAAAAAGALSIAVASPASAATSSSGCTVAPHKPIFAGHNSSGVKLLNYQISVNCAPGRTVFVEQQRFEEDGFLNPDDHLGTSTFTRSGVTTISNVRTLVNGESGDEEVYQKVRFRVSSGGVTSPFTGFEKGAVLSIGN